MSDKIRQHLIKKFWGKFGLPPSEKKLATPITLYEKMNNELMMLKHEKKTKEVKQRMKKLNDAMKAVDRAVGSYTAPHGNYNSVIQRTL
jgi:hypothetical protein